MQFKTVVALALAGTAFAAPEVKRATPTTGDAGALASVYAVLVTALPSSLVQLGLTNQGALATQINSDLVAGKASWFTQLPTDVQSYLKSVGESQYHLTVPTATGATAAQTTGSVASITGSAASAASSAASSAAASASSKAASAASSASKSGAAASSTATGGASMPTAVIGAGVAGALGFIGMLAL